MDSWLEKMYFTLPYLGGQISCGVAFARHGLGQLECVLCVCAFRFFNTSTPAFHTELFVQKQTRWDYLTDAILLSRTFLIQFFRDKFITHWHTCNCLAYFNFLFLRKFMQNHAIKLLSYSSISHLMSCWASQTWKKLWNILKRKIQSFTMSSK